MVELSKKYTPLIANTTRYFVVTGGRGSGKSFTVSTILMGLTFEVGHKVLFTRYTLTSANTSIIPEFTEKIEMLGASPKFGITKDEIIHMETGSSIIFKGIKTSSGNQTAALKSLQGVSTFVLDEAEELVDESIFDKIDLSIRKKGVQNRVILILNPTTKESWIYKRFFESLGISPGFNGINRDVTYIHTTYKDNIENLSPSFIGQVERIRETNPKKYEHQIMGGWLDKAEGVIITNWVIGCFQEAGKVVYGQDYGFSVDPTTLIKTSIDKDAKKIYCKLLLYRAGLTTSQIAEINLLHAGKDLIYGDSAEPRLIAELRERGCNIIPATKGQGSITAGISILQDFQLVIDPDSIELIKELNNYVWNDKRSGTPIDDYNHAIDALRYAVYSQLVDTFSFYVG